VVQHSRARLACYQSEADPQWVDQVETKGWSERAGRVEGLGSAGRASREVFLDNTEQT